MRLTLPLLALLACNSACDSGKVPDDFRWTEGDFACTVDVPDAPDVDGADWVASSPPTSGDIIILGTSPAAPDRVYAGSGQNGIFRSEDQGFSWTDVSGHVAHIYGQFAVSRGDADCLAYATGQGFVSANGGDTWQVINLVSDEPQGIQGLAFLEQRLYVATAEGNVYTAEDCEGSATWLARIPLEPSTVSPSTTSSHGQISSLMWLASTDTTLYAMFRSGQLSASNDGGRNWVTLATDSTWMNVTLRADEAYLWVVRQNADNTFDVQRRTSGVGGSESFETVATLPGTASGGFLTEGGEYLVSSSTGIWSSDQEEIGADLQDDGRGLYSVGRVGTTLLAGYRGGVSVSPDDGASWGWTSEEMVDLDISNAMVHPVCPNVVFAGTQCKSGLFRSEDWGMTWTRASQDMHYTMGVALSAKEPGEIWSVTDDELLRSLDYGDTWTYMYPKGYGVAGAHYHGLGVSPHRPSTVLVGSVGSGEYSDDTARVYRTDNRGATWTTSSTGLPASTESFHVIHFSELVPGAVLLGTYRAGGGVSHAGEGSGIGVFRSLDFGKTWAHLSSTTAISFSHLAECDERIYAATEQGVLVTDDLGDTWATLLPAALDSEVLNVACAGDRVIAVDPAAGIFRSGDAGATWEDWTGSIEFSLQEWESQLGLELSPDGEIAYFTHPGEGVLLRGWE
ncbi:MAG: hypothetical protein V4850_23360 [Myxococcota bacterium]